MALDPAAPSRPSRRLPSRLAPVVFAFYMAGMVAFMMTLVLTAINTGFDAGYWMRVLKGYAVAMPVGFISVMAVRPLVVRLVAWTVAPAAAPPGVPARKGRGS